ncbi:hypothetical protein MMC28_002423 [Mycoblastus sanguinarius]|nr:hypothetical protein [Mycoblastus sanguinarius]
MSAKLTVKDLLERNKAFAANFKPFPLLSELGDAGMSPPSILIVTCADPRCIPEQFLNLQPPETVVFRNMCGHVAPDINGILALDYFLTFSEIMVVHHTDCGSTHFTDNQVREALKARLPKEQTIDTMAFGTITNVEQSVKDDLAFLKQSNLVRKELADNAYGFVYDLKTGLLSAVEG